MTPTSPSPSRIDLGRVVAVTIFALMFLLNAFKLSSGSHSGEIIAVVNALLIMSFYGLLVWAYLKRSPSEHTDRQWSSWLVAFLGTAAPFSIPMVSDGTRGGALGVVAAVVLGLGLAAMLWALGALGTNISIVPQAREVVTHGPYARVRHPLYTAEIFNVIGLCLGTVGALPWVVLVGLVIFQFLRARREEALLVDRLPGYADYQSRTPMLVPWIGAR